MTPAEIELIESFIDDRLPESESESLRELLRHKANARAYLRSLATVDSGIRDLAFAPSELKEPLSFLESEELDRLKSTSRNGQLSQEKRSRLFFPSKILIASAAVIAGIAIIFTLFNYNIGQTFRDVATVEQISNGAQLSSPMVLGERIDTTPIELTSGILNLRFDSGAIVTIHGPARFIPIDERGGILEYGILFGKAPIDHKGLRIAGPNFDVTDLGTEFVIKVDKAQGAELFVIEGSVALSPTGGEQVTVRQDDGYHIDLNNRVRLLNDGQIKESFSKLLLARRDPRGVLSPDTAAYFSFAGNKSDAWRDVVTGMLIPATVSADPQTGAAILNGTNGITIRERADLLIDFPMSFEALIYIERADYLDPLFSVHARTPENRAGWGVSINKAADGSIFPVFQYYNLKQYDFSQVSLPVGRWVHFMFTVDGSMVRLYVDGVLKSESPYAGPMSKARDAGMYIGIGGRGNRRLSEFLGKVSYFAVHNRVLTQQEIQNRIKLGDQP